MRHAEGRSFETDPGSVLSTQNDRASLWNMSLNEDTIPSHQGPITSPASFVVSPMTEPVVAQSSAPAFNVHAASIQPFRYTQSKQSLSLEPAPPQRVGGFEMPPPIEDSSLLENEIYSRSAAGMFERPDRPGFLSDLEGIESVGDT